MRSGGTGSLASGTWCSSWTGRSVRPLDPLQPYEDPRRVLEQRSNQEHNPQALLLMRRRRQDFVREYTTDRGGPATRTA
jgi:hypothetical protein